MKSGTWNCTLHATGLPPTLRSSQFRYPFGPGKRCRRNSCPEWSPNTSGLHAFCRDGSLEVSILLGSLSCQGSTIWFCQVHEIEHAAKSESRTLPELIFSSFPQSTCHTRTHSLSSIHSSLPPSEREGSPGAFRVRLYPTPRHAFGRISKIRLAASRCSRPCAP